jgi:hypothetical protein
MTENEAKGKLCPLQFAVTQQGNNITPFTHFCYGSACMGWQFDNAAAQQTDHGFCRLVQQRSVIT